MSGMIEMEDVRMLDVIRQILGGGLPYSTTVIAVRLVLASTAGQINLPWADFEEQCGCGSGNGRRHLVRLAQAGLIHYSTNANVYITWLAWLGSDQRESGEAPGERLAKNARERAKTDTNSGEKQDCVLARTKNARQRVRIARQRAKNDMQDEDLLYIGSYQEGKKEHLDPTFPVMEQRALTEHAYAMLEACGIFSEDAHTLADTVPFEELFLIALRWSQEGNAGPGALKYRIMHRHEANWRPKPLVATDLYVPFYLLWWPTAADEPEVAGTPVEQREEASTKVGRTAEATAQERGALHQQCSTARGDAINQWREVLETLQAMQGQRASGVLRWLGDCSVVGDNDRWAVAAPAHCYDWLRLRMRHSLEAMARFVCGRAVTIEFQCM